MEAAFAFAGVAAAIIPVGLIILGIVAVSAGRREEDPFLERPRVLYLALGAYLGLYVFFAGLITVVIGIVELITDDSDIEPIRDQFIANIIRGAIVTLVGLAVLAVHDRWALRTIGPNPSAGTRLWVRGQLVTAFTALLILIAGVVFTAFGAFTVLAPDLANVSDREEGLIQFLPGAVAAAVAAGILMTTLARTRGAASPIDPEPGDDRTVDLSPPPPPPSGTWAPTPPPGPRQAAVPPAAPSPLTRDPDPDPAVFAPEPEATTEPEPEPDAAPDDDRIPAPASDLPYAEDDSPRPPARKAAPRIRRSRPLRPPAEPSEDAPPPPPE